MAGGLQKELEGTQTILRKKSRCLVQTMVKDLTKTVLMVVELRGPTHVLVLKGTKA